jgi:hypothetical protein
MVLSVSARKKMIRKPKKIGRSDGGCEEEGPEEVSDWCGDAGVEGVELGFLDGCWRRAAEVDSGRQGQDIAAVLSRDKPRRLSTGLPTPDRDRHETKEAATAVAPEGGGANLWVTQPVPSRAALSSRAHSWSSMSMRAVRDPAPSNCSSPGSAPWLVLSSRPARSSR